MKNHMEKETRYLESGLRKIIILHKKLDKKMRLWFNITIKVTSIFYRIEWFIFFHRNENVSKFPRVGGDNFLNKMKTFPK